MKMKRLLAIITILCLCLTTVVYAEDAPASDPAAGVSDLYTGTWTETIAHRATIEITAADEGFTVHVEWPGASRRVSEDGYFRIDFAGQRAHGEVRGIATQAHIRPLMEVLDIPSVMPYFDAFTDVPSPVDAAGEFAGNLINNDFRMILDLRPEMG